MVWLTELPFGLRGRVFRSGLPGYRDGGRILDEAGAVGVDTVVALTTPDEADRLLGRQLRSVYEPRGWQVFELPTPNLGAPEPAALAAAVEQVWSRAAAGHGVLVHCLAGIGRAGVFLACLARYGFGWPAPRALAWLRHHVPGAVETEEQLESVVELQVRLPV